MPRAEIVGPFPEGVEAEAYDQLRRRVLWALPQGLYLLSSRAGEVRNLMAVSLVSQLATAPKLLGVSVESDALTSALIAQSGRFLLVVLARTERGAIRHFVKPPLHDGAARTLAGYPYRDAPHSGLPIPAIAAAYLDCDVRETLDLGSHRLFVGEVVDVAAPDEEALAAPLRMEDTRMSYGG